AEERERSQQAIGKLLIVGSIPALGFLAGVSLLIFLISQRLMRGKDALLARHGTDRWTTPWTGDTVWQVFVLGFFVIGQVFLPSLLSGLFQVLRISPTNFNEQTRAFSVLASYILLSSGGLFVLYLSLKPYFPLPEGWFQFRWWGSWLGWGFGGYFAAIPLVIAISLINQRLWQGQGGSNPILPIALEGKDKIALAVFFITASIAAPLFEEFMFRGFLLPSLTRYMPVTAAIVLSSFLFALAHLNLSEVLPLTVLGMVLGVVYTRSRNLLSSMLLHGLWNSGTLISLIVLGSGSGS
ncbi:MAG: CPBP family intramembrane glutamic endopeptidase, partial [Leptolyngbyaceae cyanobacterium bins.59]|nr:CPBP family intramembrane glutamic endopeptidase [Leptolyngbyaceae cyanobacterium bins.59]